MELSDLDPTLLDVVDQVCSELLAQAVDLEPADLMLVGAHARDLLQASRGQTYRLRGTEDLDVGIALADWGAYEQLTARLPRRGDTGIQFDVRGVRTDLLPFGPVEDPTGTVKPGARGEPLSVWGFTEVFLDADSLRLPGAGSIRIPTPAGYAALKLAAWLDRSAYGQYKDASDVAAALVWYGESEGVTARLYADEDLLVSYDVDLDRASSHLLGHDVAEVIGPGLLAQLRERWPGERPEALPLEMNLPGADRWPTRLGARLERLNAFEDGAGLPRTATNPR